MSCPIQTPLPVPSHPNTAPPRELTEKEQAEYDSVLAHFTNPDYVLPTVEAEKGALTEEERMWLVRLHFLSLSRPISRVASIPVVRVHPALLTRHQTRRVREHQAPRRHPQMEARLWALLLYHTRARPARSCHWQRVHLWIRHARQTSALHVSE